MEKFLIGLGSRILPKRSWRKNCRARLEQIHNQKAYDYLSKYSPKDCAAPAAVPLPDVKNLPIWILWMQGEENAPAVVKKCIQSARSARGGRPVILIDGRNMGEYIALPGHITSKYKKGLINNTHLSDIIRVVLLEKYGGTWADATVLFTAPVPPVITGSPFFVFRVDEENPMHKFHIASNWFIHSAPGHIFNAKQKEMLFNYWAAEERAVDYFIFHLMFRRMIYDNPSFYELWQKIPVISNLGPHKLQAALPEKFDMGKFEEIKKQSSVHKLTYKLPPCGEDSFLSHILKN